MLLNYIKIAFRNLAKNKSFSIINILGFAFSISICLLILLFILKENSYDKFHENYDRIYRLSAVNNLTDYQTAQMAMDKIPQVANACALDRNLWNEWLIYDKKAYKIGVSISTDNNFFQIFTVEFTYGNIRKALPDINSCILTEKVAKNIFGDENPIGRVITKGIVNGTELIVSGVIKDFPENSSIKAEIFVNIENKKFSHRYFTDPKNPELDFHPSEVFLLLTGKEAAQTAIASFAKNPDILTHMPGIRGLIL